LCGFLNLVADVAKRFGEQVVLCPGHAPTLGQNLLIRRCDRAVYVTTLQNAMVVFKTDGYRGFCMIAGALVSVWFCWEGVVQSDAQRPVWIILVLASAVFVLRAWSLRVVVTDDSVVVHSWLGSRRVPLQEIGSVLQTPLVGSWPAEVPVDWWNRVLIRRTDGSAVSLPLVSLDRRGDGGRAARVASELEQLVRGR